MKMFSIEGASDDLVEMSVDDGGPDSRSRQEEASVPGGIWVGSLFSRSTGGQLHVVLRYEDDGVWSAGLCQVEEGYALPSWPVTFDTSTRHDGSIGYATVINIEVPDDTVLNWSSEDEVGELA